MNDWINLPVMANPINWVIVLLMVMIPMIAVTLIGERKTLAG